MAKMHLSHRHLGWHLQLEEGLKQVLSQGALQVPHWGAALVQRGLALLSMHLHIKTAAARHSIVHGAMTKGRRDNCDAFLMGMEPVALTLDLPKWQLCLCLYLHRVDQDAF